MKETGLIPNAVSMLHGLCQDGLVQEAMKLFSLMHETGTIPEVIIYTAVIEGFCKAHKLDDAKRIFRKMQGNGISPNAITYGVLIQGLVHKKSLDNALVFSVEMLEAGHSPNLATFTGLVDCFFNWFFFAINMGALLVYMSCLYVNTSDYICCYYTDPAGAEVKYNTSEDSEDSLPCTRFDETKQINGHCPGGCIHLPGSMRLKIIMTGIDLKLLTMTWEFFCWSWTISAVNEAAVNEAELERLKHALKLLSEAEKHMRVSSERSTWFTATLLQLGSVPSPDPTQSGRSRGQTRKCAYMNVVLIFGWFGLCS
ncbi:hypothetical protein POM88_046271 [Heracleum sosnowskyi]|uniref:Pentatricopeptide repeat-containing protein n=1 Tax=Heracleum sosnowskyi TaxID=360622 RepID=A0AAD8H919_9APIA|nr:hypothetical protein POM88_046271 [Heracleum sosnowskyi]